LLVCGGRDFSDKQVAVKWIGRIHKMHEVGQVIHGAAKGADSIAEEVAKFMGIAVREFPADWNAHGKAAGPIRNKQMLDEGKPDMVLALPGGRGTENMITQTRERGIAVLIVGR
jgi:hypothetical protein